MQDKSRSSIVFLGKRITPSENTNKDFFLGEEGVKMRKILCKKNDILRIIALPNVSFFKLNTILNDSNYDECLTFFQERSDNIGNDLCSIARLDEDQLSNLQYIINEFIEGNKKKTLCCLETSDLLTLSKDPDIKEKFCKVFPSLISDEVLSEQDIAERENYQSNIKQILVETIIDNPNTSNVKLHEQEQERHKCCMIL